MKILPNCIFNNKNPIIIGVEIVDGILYKGTPICIPNKNHIELGQITNIQINNKNIEFAEKNQEVAISITPNISTQHYSYGRHFTHEDILVSKITKHPLMQ